MRVWQLLIILCVYACSTAKVGQEKQSGGLEKIALLQSEAVPLGEPRWNIDSLWFRGSTGVSLAFDLPEASIYYTLDDSEPIKYTAPFTLSQSTVLRAQSRREGFMASDWQSETVVQLNDKVKKARAELNPAANEKYPGGGAASFIDLQRGTLDFRSGQAWSGFQSPEIAVNLHFELATVMEKIYLSALSDHRSWIFLPERVEVWEGDKMLGSTPVGVSEAAEKASRKLIPVAIPSGQYRDLLVKIISPSEIPAWHAGKGYAPWLFLDEILIN